MRLSELFLEFKMFYFSNFIRIRLQYVTLYQRIVFIIINQLLKPHTVTIKIEKWFFMWDSSNDSFSGKKKDFFLRNSIHFPLKTKHQRENLESVLAWVNFYRKKNPFSFSHRCSHLLGVSNSIYNKDKTYTILCAFPCIQFCPPNESFIESHSIVCLFDSFFFLSFFHLYSIIWDFL